MAIRRELFTLIICTLTICRIQAQNFGSSYDFLNKESNARTAALGGIVNSLSDKDIHMVLSNPAVANGQMAKTVGFTFNPSFAQVRQYNVAFADSVSSIGNTFGTLQFLDYGTLKRTDETGALLGTFRASQYALAAGTSQKKGNFKLGASLKFIGFQADAYSSLALAIDLGMFFQHPRKPLTWGVAARNIGFTLKKMNDRSMPVPLNLQTSLSYKLEHMPLRVTAGAFYIQETDLQYVDYRQPGVIDANGQETKPKKKISEQIGRHLSLGGEFLFHRNFNVLFGYNHLRRKELRPQTGAGLTGFSLGFALKLKKFDLSYSYSGWESSGGQHFLTLSLRLGEFSTQTQ